MSFSSVISDTNIQSEIVLLKDERQAVLNAKQHPYVWICSLEVEFAEPVLYPLATLEQTGKNWKNTKPSLKGCGTGVLISPTHVLTAAHVISGLKVIAKGKEKYFKLVKAKKVRVIPARTENTKAHNDNAFMASNLFVSDGFKKGIQKPVLSLNIPQVKQCLSSDYGIIELNHVTRSNASGSWRMEGFGWWRKTYRYKIIPATGTFRNRLKHKFMKVAGYPGDKGKVSCSSLWKATGKIATSTPKIGGQSQSLLLYDADTSAGMSGSPVWITRKGKNYLIGVHSSFIKYPGPNGKLVTYNVAALVTPQMLNELRQWKVNYLEIKLTVASA